MDRFRKPKHRRQLALLLVLLILGWATTAASSSTPRCVGAPPGPKDANGCPKDSDGDGVPDYKDECPDTPPGAAGCAYGCSILRPIVINLVNDEFEVGSATLSTEMRDTLQTLVEEVLSRESISALTIVGHTDTTGSEEFNQRLSELRARAVADFLLGAGLIGVELHVEGAGETSPLVEELTDADLARNRRVEIFTHQGN